MDAEGVIGYGSSRVSWSLAKTWARATLRLCSFLLCSAALYSNLVVAQPALPGLQVDWSAPSGCPNRDVLLQLLRERLPERTATITLRAQARVQRSGGGFRLDLELTGPGAFAKRSVSDSQCAPLAEAAAVLIVLAVRSEVAETEGEADAEDQAAEASPPPAAGGVPERETRRPELIAPAPESSPSPSPSTSTSTSTSASTSTFSAESGGEAEHESAPWLVRLQLTAAGRASLGTFPHQPALGVQGQVAARIRSLFIGLGFTYWPPSAQQSSSYPNARLRGSGLFSDLSVGLDVLSRPLLLTAAVDVEVGQLSARAEAIAGPQSSRTLWLATGPSAALGIAVLRDWMLAVELAGLVPVYRTHWLLRTPAGDVPAFVAAQVSWRLSLRLSYVLPL